MKDIFKLFINGNSIDFESEPTFPVTYQQEDFSNPTAIKNSFSKTIKIEGTDNNNKIFGEIYNLDREQLYKFKHFNGAYFDPSKRTPFELYKNSELIESGYMQLTDITIQNYKITYNITLYGGLGDFFYSLMYNEDGEKKTLSDLYFKIEDLNGNIIDKETELNFKITKDFVAESWNALKNGDEDNYIHNFITFAPAYNGLYQDFANNVFCVNTHKSELFNKDNFITENEVTYETYDGYKLAKTEREFTEWDIKDLRSYMQRPVLKFKKVLSAICDEYNNGGYKVKLDKTFFNENNPYYNKAYLALPLLPTVEAEDNEENTKYKLYADRNYPYNYFQIGEYNNEVRLQTTYRLAFDGDEILSSTASNGFIINTQDIPVTSTFDVDIDFSLNFFAKELNETMNNEELYLSYLHRNYSVTIVNNRPVRPILQGVTPIYKSIIVQAYVYDIDNPETEINSSTVLNFTTPIEYEGTTYTSTYDKWINWVESPEKLTYTNVFGSFKREKQTNKYTWVSNDGVSNFYLNIKDVPKHNNMAIALRFWVVYSHYKNDSYAEETLKVNKLIPSTEQIINIYNDGYFDSKLIVAYRWQYNVAGYAEIPQLYNTSTFTWKLNEPTIRSNSKITKNMLLKTDYSPCDILLNYCKLFGLYFKKDIHSKTINIITKNHFFNGEVIDLNNRIDYSNQVVIKPYLFETKYYLMKNEENESYYAKKYENEYNVIYGQKRIDTNYNFNEETKNVYDGTVFQNAISATDSSNYFRTFFNYNNKIVPAWLLDNPTFELYNGVGGENMQIYEKQESYKDWVNINNVVNWNAKSGYDMFAKTCFYTQDNNNKSLCDINSTLLFFNGFKPLKDNNNNTITYWLSDDVPQMNLLNDGEMCYLYTESEFDFIGEYYGTTIAIRYNELPQFTRYYYNSNNVSDSFDFGLPKETYILNINYEEDATLYNKFWKKYLSDRYNINTKKVTCYVNLEGMNINQDSLRKFYYFNNSLWVMNKIENYFSNQYKTTKVEFVKVNDTDNYTNSQFQYEYNAIELSEDSVVIDYHTTTYSFELTSTGSWNATTDRKNRITPISGDSGTYRIEITMPENELQYEVSKYFKFRTAGDEKTFEVLQLPSPNVARMLKGYVYNENLNVVLSKGELYIRNKSENHTKAVTLEVNESGYFESFVSKLFFDEDGNTYINVLDSDGNVLYENTVIKWDELSNHKENDIIIS